MRTFALSLAIGLAAGARLARDSPAAIAPAAADATDANDTAVNVTDAGAPEVASNASAPEVQDVEPVAEGDVKVTDAAPETAAAPTEAPAASTEPAAAKSSDMSTEAVAAAAAASSAVALHVQQTQPVEAAPVAVEVASKAPPAAPTAAVAAPDVKEEKAQMETEAARKHVEVMVKKGGISKTVAFERRLLICNAYAGATASKVMLNDKVELTAADQGGDLLYKQCRFFKGEVAVGDRIDVSLNGVGGTFEVDALPSSDAVLLLVVERRDVKTSLVGFQSFAFPKNGMDTAQVAIVDTLKSSSPAHLNMQDHYRVDKDGKPTETLQIRMEKLGMNRVYAVQTGNYDADIVSDENEEILAKRKTMRLEAGTDYVFLRTGTNDPDGQDLVVFPSAAAPLATAACFLLAAIAF